jgi:hypothetical protein
VTVLLPIFLSICFWYSKHDGNHFQFHEMRYFGLKRETESRHAAYFYQNLNINTLSIKIFYKIISISYPDLVPN